MNKVDQIEKVIYNLGISCLNEMQQEAYGKILEEYNVLLLSQTGSGKTLAYLLPVLKILRADIQSVQCLIIVPSRELVLQIESVWKKMGTPFKVNACYGGHSMETEIKNLSNPPALLIGTPGRIADHIQRGTFRLDKIQTLVLDEFDKSLQLGFHEQMSFIINRLVGLQRRILISATSDIEIPRFLRFENPIMIDYTHKIEDEKRLSLKIVHSDDKDKINTLVQLLSALNSEQAIVFCNHREAAERIAESLCKRGIYASYYHGGMDQEERERALVQFRNGSISYLITTDLAARGLDIPEMNHVVHYHLPLKEEEFTHRNGRTARMKATGTVYVLFNDVDKKVDYLDYESIEVFSLENSKSMPKPPAFQTLYIGGGKKNKINKIDIVGFFLNKGALNKSDIGLIEVKDFNSFVAVKFNKVAALLKSVRDEKLKGKKYKIEVARNVIKKVG